MQLRFYPYDFEYRLKDGKVFMLLYAKLEDGSKACIWHEHQPYFFVGMDNVNTTNLEQELRKLQIDAQPEPAKVMRWEPCTKQLLGKERPFWKIFTNYPKAVPVIAKQIEEWGLSCYERDILFVHRYLRDVGLTPLCLAEAEGEFANEPLFRIPIFHAQTVTQVSKEPCTMWKILSLDIETYAERKEINPKKNPILMMAFYGLDMTGKEFRKVLTWKQFPHELDYLELCSDEATMLERFRQIMLDYQPDILTGYYTDGFDLPYIKARAEKFSINLNLGLDHSDLITGARDEEARIKGILHLDMLKFIKYIFGKNLKTDSFSLDAVSEELLGYHKHKVDLDRLAPIWNEHPDQLPAFCAYNLHDAYLAFQLCHTLLPDMIEFTKIIGLPTNDVIRMSFSRLVENYILTRAMEYNVLAPNKPVSEQIERRQQESIQGAFVLEPLPGLYKNLVVFDFRSLYPTIITAHNIGPEGLQCSCCQDKPHVPEKEQYWFCQREKKFLPTVLEELILRRADLKRLIKEAQGKGEDTKLLESRSYALKILGNSFYGYLGFYGARWYCLECAASTTAYARDYIKKTIQKAEEKGFQVIYADTDSCFLLLDDKPLDSAMEFMNEINFDLPGQMELELQGYYPRGIFVAVKGAEKGTEKGAKKKYALISKQGKIKITGFETVRRNWSSIAKEIQEHVLQLILQDKTEEAVAYVREQVKELKKGTVPLPKVIIKTQITKDLSQYESVGPHVAVARQLIARGDPVTPGTIVEYIIVKGIGIIRERAKIPEEVKEGEYDADYYINNQIIPAVASIFAVLGYAEDQLFRDDSQTGLGKFFGGKG